MKEFKLLLLLLLNIKYCWCSLYPRDSSSRDSKSLDGIWSFRLSPKMDQEVGFREEWYRRPLEESGEVMDMPVPASYNDITTDPTIRDYVGWVWYSRKFFISSSWQNEAVFIRFGSVHYTCIVYVNGEPATSHSGGHLPFQEDISSLLSFSQENWITVAVNNTLTRYTVPQGSYEWKEESDKYPAGYSTLEFSFDFFNYAGIHRPVLLYTVPRNLYISDITTTTLVSEDLSTATLSVKADVKIANETDSMEGLQCVLTLLDRTGRIKVAESFSCQDDIEVYNPQLWWPYLMSDRPGYLHKLEITVSHAQYGMDTYQLPIGLREVSWGNSSFQINHRNFYFRGFGRHEDSNIRGKGLDLPLVLRDYNLIKWVGANSYRTSHYPYADEIMDLADQNGIVIIDECAGVALDYFEDDLLKNHLNAMTELVDRDKNRPSVVMWSVGNEPRPRKAAGEYFRKVYEHTRSLDTTRAITLVVNAVIAEDYASEYYDVIGINRYYGWYSDTGHLELIQRQVFNEIKNWRAARGKPIMITEYGADTVPGLHTLPSVIFSEEYQAEYMGKNFLAFDQARAEGWFIGEMIWNFADFNTKQESRRVAGNKKGIFTRDRMPKMSAHVLARRYWQLAEEEFSFNKRKDDVCHF